MSPSPPPPNRSSMFGIAGLAADAGLAEAVVAGALLVVGEHGVGPGDLLEALGRVRVVGVGVGVQLARPLAVGLLEVVGGRRPGHARAVRSSRPHTPHRVGERAQRPATACVAGERSECPPFSLAFSEPAAEALADDVDGGQRLRVVHARRAEHADRADVFAVDHDRRDDDRAGRQRLDAVLDADRHRHAAVDEVAHERDDHELLLQRLQHLAHDVDRLERLGDRRRAADVDVVVGETGADGGERASRTARRPPGRRTAGSPQTGQRARPTDSPRGGPRPRSRTDVGDRCRRSRRSRSRPCRCRARAPPSPPSTTSRTSWALRMVAASDFGPTTTAALCVSLVEQVGRLVEHLLQPAVGGGEEVTDLAGHRGIERVRRGEVVDEEAVALVGRDAPGRGVGLDQEALLLEHRHLVADGGRRHADARCRGDVRGPDRLRGRDVLLHHGAQDCGLAIVEHAGSQDYRVLTDASPGFGAVATDAPSMRAQGLEP